MGIRIYPLDRSRIPAAQPLLVIFERPDCHACEVLHGKPLQDPAVRRRLRDFELVQLAPWDRTTPVLRPDGRRSTPAERAANLGVFHTPAPVFFDPRGKEIFRMDSVVQFFRLAGSCAMPAKPPISASRYSTIGSTG